MPKVYHGTALGALLDILERGVLGTEVSRYSGTYASFGGLYVTDSPNVAETYAGEASTSLPSFYTSDYPFFDIEEYEEEKEELDLDERYKFLAGLRLSYYGLGEPPVILIVNLPDPDEDETEFRRYVAGFDEDELRDNLLYDPKWQPKIFNIALKDSSFREWVEQIIGEKQTEGSISDEEVDTILEYVEGNIDLYGEFYEEDVGDYLKTDVAAKHILAREAVEALERLRQAGDEEAIDLIYDVAKIVLNKRLRTIPSEDWKELEVKALVTLPDGRGEEIDLSDRDAAYRRVIEIVKEYIDDWEKRITELHLRKQLLSVFLRYTSMPR